MGMFQNIRVYLLAFIVYFGIVLFGYDTGIGGGVVAQAAFQAEFTPGASKSHISRVTQNVVAVLQGGATVGSIASPFISGAVGRKPALFGYSLVFVLGAILQTIAGGSRGISYVYAGRTIAGLGIGGISAIAPAYVSESSPKDVRGRITGLFQIMVAIGVMLSYFVNYGISLHLAHRGYIVWRLPFGLQLLFGGIMAIGLLICKESPRWLATKGRKEEAIANLAYLRYLQPNDPAVLDEFAEIEASIEEERVARSELGIKEAFLGKGNWPRFLIAFVFFLLQQWSGQNTVGYYAPQIFQSIGYTGTTPSLLASGVYGILKVVATAAFIFFGIETLGRVWSLRISAFGMGTLFYIVGAILKTHPVTNIVAGASPPPASKAMAAMLYLYVCFYSMGWGPIPWVYCADIFPTATRAYGLGFASATQWFFNFIVSWWSLSIVNKIGWKSFIMFGTINLGGMFVFTFFLPETKGLSLEEMDIIFGAVAKDKRDADIARTAAQLGVPGASGVVHESSDVDKHSDEKLADRV